ncbi:MAG: hypothetical protein OEZ34_06195 [Spirochaetia bacterium]|nr:hypothetical protein [Spirochaetia bacterium]
MGLLYTRAIKKNKNLMAKVDKPMTPEAYMELLDYTASVDLVQSMEARGDFKFKGIFALFNSIMDWTNKFPTNGILPTMEQLARDTGIPHEKLKEYMDEMLGLGSSKDRMIFSMPALDYVTSPEPGLVQMTVYCRPTKADGTSVKRYVLTYVEKNVGAIQKWISSKSTNQGMEYSEYISQYIEKGRLPDSQAGAEIARLFYFNQNLSAEMKKIIYVLHARPAIQRLIEIGQLVLLPDRNSADSMNYRGVFYSDQAQIQERMTTLVNYFSNNISPVPVSGADNQSELNEALRVFDDARMASLPAGHKQVVYEIKILQPKVQKLIQEESSRKESESLEKFIDDLAKAGRIVDLERIKNVDEETLDKIPSISSVLYAEFPMQGRVAPLVLHKNAVMPAVKQARDVFDRIGDDMELRILISMGVEKLLDEEHLKAFHSTEQRMLFMKLPWFVRLWRSLFGHSKISPAEAAKAKKDMMAKTTEEKIRLQTVEAKKAQKKLASERIKSSSSSSYEPPPSEQMQAEDQEKALERIENEEKVKAIIVCLDKAWDEGAMPNRTFLLENFPEFTEDTLILFLKKYARKEILSFRINHDKPEYVWPFLITKRYLKQKGKSLLSKYSAMADKQRNASMPNQEQFDVATSLEDFLGRVLPKLS